MRNLAELQTSGYAILQSKAVLHISGKDALAYLQGQFTQNIDLLKQHPFVYGCVLSPQGKTVADGWLLAKGQDVWLVHEASLTDKLLTRLRMFTLGHDVHISPCDIVVSAWWQAAAEHIQHQQSQLLLPLRMHGIRAIWLLSEDQPPQPNAQWLRDEDEWDRVRILGGLPRLGKDWMPDDYPLNANLREFDGISFDKGCYVGQEIASRMHWRNGVRHALYRVSTTTKNELPCPADIVTSATIGKLSSTAIDDGGRQWGIARLPSHSEAMNDNHFRIAEHHLTVVGLCGKDIR